MTDMFGIPLKVGDEVLYTNSGKGDSELKLGIIMAEDANGYAEVKSILTGKKQFHSKRPNEIASVAPYREMYPEFFI